MTAPSRRKLKLLEKEQRMAKNAPEVTIVVKGGLDLTDPKMVEALEKAIEELSNRRIRVTSEPKNRGAISAAMHKLRNMISAPSSPKAPAISSTFSVAPGWVQQGSVISAAPISAGLILSQQTISAISTDPTIEQLQPEALADELADRAAEALKESLIDQGLLNIDDEKALDEAVKE